MAVPDLPSSRSAAEFASTEKRSVTEGVYLFQKFKAVHTAYCVAGIFLVLAPTLFEPNDVFGGLLTSLCFVGIWWARLWASKLEDQERALDLFGRLWLTMSSVNCMLFVLGNHLFSFCVDIPIAVTYVTSCFIAMVPVYLHLNGINTVRRLSICTWTALTFYLGPQFTVMDRDQATLMMWISLLVGETLGAHLLAKLIREAGAASVARGSPSVEYSLDDGKRLANCASGECAAGTYASWEPPTVSENLHSYVRRRDFAFSSLDMRELTLCFEDTAFEVLYGAHSMVNSREEHKCIAVGTTVVCATGAYLSPPFRTIGLLCALFAALIGHAHHKKRSGCDEISEYLFFCREYTFFRRLFTAVFIASALLDLDSEWSLLRATPAEVGSPLDRVKVTRQHDAMLLFKGLDGGGGSTDVIGLVCGAMLLMLAGVHHRLVVLPPPTRMSNRLILLVGVACSQFDVQRAVLNPTAFPVFILASSLLMVGELVGFSVDHVRRTVFRDRAIELYHTFNEWAAVAARLESLSANAQVLERANASQQAELAADQRLNHVVKGRCGSAMSAVETFRELLGPHLKHDLPLDVADLLVAPISHLREAIEWCHRRQVFVQLEKGSYLSRHTAVDINQVLRSRLGSADTLHTDVPDALALDETVLKIAFDEVLSNALKYRKKMTPLRTSARFEQGVLHVSVENDNPDEFVPLTSEECKLVMLPRYKSHTCSAMSDGLGLDSVSIAVRAAAGAVKLEQSATCTVAHFWLPATLRGSSSQQPTPKGPRRDVATSSAGIELDHSWASADALPSAPVCADSSLPPALAGRACSLALAGPPPAPEESDVASRVDSGTTNAASTEMAEVPLPQPHDGITGEQPALLAPSGEGPGSDRETDMAAARVGDTDALSCTRGQLSRPLARLEQGEDGVEPSGEQCPEPSSQEPCQPANSLATGQTCAQPPLAPPQPHGSETKAQSTSEAGVPAAEAAATRGLRVVGLDDEKIPRMVQGMFMLHHLHADMQASCTLGETREEMLAVVDVVLGELHADLSPNSGERRAADVVLLDENIMPPFILGSKIASKLRGRGFAGVIVILTGATASCIKKMQSNATVDFVFEKGTPLPKMAELIFEHIALRPKDQATSARASV